MDYNEEWLRLSLEEKKKQLYLRQVKTLNDFLERGAISREQYEKSLHDLTEKMGMTDDLTIQAVENSKEVKKQEKSQEQAAENDAGTQDWLEDLGDGLLNRFYQ